MADKPDYLTLNEILQLHAEQITLFGGAHGIRDVGQLEAAIGRPQQGYYPDIIAEASALWESLSQNHPFVDGNKRTAFASMHVFLLINGWRLTADHEETWLFVSSLYETHSFRFDVLEPWLRQHVVKAK
ncbi:MAG: type II toxin-antitoxin system death-on-curing family toxin [Asticcacaulis sp.]|nr:type II toxin-antitoxin system death-on-curing family toxin [Asticcacaulis sp.]